MDVVMALANAGKTDVKVIGGRYGLGSKDTPPASVFAVYEELAKADVYKRQELCTFSTGFSTEIHKVSSDLKWKKLLVLLQIGNILLLFFMQPGFDIIPMHVRTKIRSLWTRFGWNLKNDSE